ncbi:MAG TPA: hypothetical protein VEK15_29100 [Vicinamibacteria bacterium]|nr:hypothetical protein [Vicinamibacteria bacterium]
MIVFGIAFVAFLLALGVLFGLEGNCAGSCDGSDEPRCDFCPQRRAEDARNGGRR